MISINTKIFQFRKFKKKILHIIQWDSSLWLEEFCWKNLMSWTPCA